MQVGGTGSAFARSPEAMEYALKASSAGAVGIVPGVEGGPFRIAPGSGELEQEERVWLYGTLYKGVRKACLAAAEIRAAGADFGYVVDMQDRRVRNCAQNGGAPYPVFSFNRLKDDRSRILWPMPMLHDLDNPLFLNGLRPEAVPWRDKTPGVVWRGITGGRVPGVDDDPRREGFRLKAICRRLREGKMAEDEAYHLVQRLPRYRAVMETWDDPFFDFGFVDGDGFEIESTPFHSGFAKERLSLREMQQYRYIAVLAGLDVGSGFYWAMNSGSVALVMDTSFETFASGHFRPWEHYIPFKRDLSDLAENVAWAEAHQGECQDMVLSATEVCRSLLDPNGRLRTLLGIVAEVNNSSTTIRK